MQSLIKTKNEENTRAQKNTTSLFLLFCNKSIHPQSEPCCSLFIERGVPGWKQRPTFDQEIWAHGLCLKKLISITEYSFPELDLDPSQIQELKPLIGGKCKLRSRNAQAGRAAGIACWRIARRSSGTKIK